MTAGDPYRSAPDDEPVAEMRDTGIVGDVIAQFADPLAFYRELVQNALDAGTSSVEVTIDYDDSAQAARVAVQDRGDGMDRDTLENQLVVLFRSTKERDPTKIGKFGIGFASVLAPAPRVVVVDTTCRGKRWKLHLYPSLEYELFDLGTATTNGTTVELELAMAVKALPDFARRSRTALVKWCRHANRPIHFIARSEDGNALADARIDTPLAIDNALVEVRSPPDTDTVAVVALTASGRPYGGFFNHGLMLYESTEPLLGALAFKVQDARLGHTISRDDVRRDDAYDSALAAVRALALNGLPDAIAHALADAAGRDRERYRALVEAIALADIELPDDRWMLRLVDPVDGRSSASATALAHCDPLISARESSHVTRTMAAVRVPIVDCGVATDAFPKIIRAACRREPVDIGAFVLVEPIESSADDRALVAELERALAGVHRAPSAIVLANLTNQAGRMTITSSATSTRAWLVERADALRSPFGRFRRPALVIDARDPTVREARELAGRHCVRAAGLLARAVLLAYGELDVACSERLLERGRV
jgi:hypothetical protein